MSKNEDAVQEDAIEQRELAMKRLQMWQDMQIARFLNTEFAKAEARIKHDQRQAVVIETNGPEKPY